MKIDRKAMTSWVLHALGELGGSGSILEICKYIWKKHENDLVNSGDYFYKWQYEVRWAGDLLQKEGMIEKGTGKKRGVWKLISAV